MNKKIIKIISIVFICIILLITYIPIIVIALTSISTDKLGISLNGVTFNWYIEMFKSRTLLSSIKFTILIALLSTIISIVLGTITAIGINSLSNKNKKRFIILNNIPILNADIVTAIFLLIIFQFIGIILNQSILGFTTTLIAHVLFSTPYVILSILPKLSELNDSLYEASVDLGCSPFKTLYKVIVPNIKTGIITGGLLSFTMSIDDFIITYFISGKNQNFSTWLYGSLKTLRNGLWNQACAYNTLLIIITFISIITYQILKINKKVKEEVR